MEYKRDFTLEEIIFTPFNYKSWVEYNIDSITGEAKDIVYYYSSPLDSVEHYVGYSFNQSVSNKDFNVWLSNPYNGEIKQDK